MIERYPGQATAKKRQIFQNQKYHKYFFNNKAIRKYFSNFISG